MLQFLENVGLSLAVLLQLKNVNKNSCICKFDFFVAMEKHGSTFINRSCIIKIFRVL